MPSLVEGFGQVYLEALAQGCPVLGTANTCLPDLGGEADAIFLVTPGNVELFEAADLAFRGALGGGVVKELRRTGAPMIVRPHLARSAECDEVFERVVAGEPK